jgi:hypothetical protein
LLSALSETLLRRLVEVLHHPTNLTASSRTRCPRFDDALWLRRARSVRQARQRLKG